MGEGVDYRTIPGDARFRVETVPLKGWERIKAFIFRRSSTRNIYKTVHYWEAGYADAPYEMGYIVSPPLDLTTKEEG